MVQGLKQKRKKVLSRIFSHKKLLKRQYGLKKVKERKDNVNIMSYLMCLHMKGPICQTKKTTRIELFFANEFKIFLFVK